MLSSTKSRLAGKSFLQSLFLFLLVTQICFGQWYQQSSGTTLDLNDINFSSENKVFMFGGWVKGHGGNFWGEQTLFATSNGGSEWDTTLVIYYPHLYSSCYLQNDSVGFLIHENYTWSSVCALLKTTNFGDSWIDVTPDSGFIGGDISFQNDMTGWMVGDKIYKTTDSGNSWYVDYTDSLEDFFLTSISFTPTTVWAVGEGIILKYTSQTGWVKQTSITDFWSHKVVFRDENNGWIAGLTPLMSGYPPILLRTNDGGLTWYSIPNVLYVIEDIEFIDNNLGWAIGYDSTGIGGILKTTNGGEIWEIEVGNLTSKLNAFCIKNNYGWAVGGNGLILRTTNAGLTWVANDDQKLPAEFILEQNYPNPFNPSTKIKYSVPQSSKVVIKVYDVLGNEIETLVNEEKPTGTYELTWNAVNLTSGVYFYQLMAGEYIDTKKMILLK